MTEAGALVARARALRTEGRWADAEGLLAGVHAPDASLERAELARLRSGLDRARSTLAGLDGAVLSPAQEARRLRVLASLELEEGAHTQALVLLERARVLARDAGDRDGEARALVDIGDAAAFAGGLLRAEERYHEALGLTEGLADLTVRCDALNGLAAVHRYSGRLAEAESLHLRADALAVTVGYRLGRHVALRGLAGVGMARRDLVTTRLRCAEALDQARVLGYRDGVVWCWNGLGEAARLGGDLDAAEHHYRAALDTGVAGTRRLALVANLALVELGRRKWAAARERIETALDQLSGSAGIGWRALLHGSVLGACEALGDPDGWLHHYRHAVALLAQTGEFEADLAEELEVAATLSEDRGALDRATRARSLALEQWTGLGRADRVALAGDHLARLAAAGAPIPLGPFNLAQPLGRGGAGEVWRGAHHALGTPVAVKVIVAEEARTPVWQAAFRAEVRSIAALDHPAIVTVHDHGVVSAAAERMSAGRLVDGSPFLVMELAEAGTLETRVGELGWQGLRSVVLRLLDALAHAHARGVLHRDLKPANVLVVAGGDVRLSDFGLSQASGVIAGTPTTMAPEQFVPGAAHGPTTDLYALGCLVTVLASGRWPFEAAGFAEWRHAHLHERPLPLAPVHEVPAGLEAWILRLLQKEPGDRFANASDAAWAFAHLGPPVPPTPVAAPARPAPVRNVTLSPATFDGTLPELDPPPVPLADPGGPAPCPRVAAPVPEAPPEEREGRGWLPGAGLGLLALRRPPLVGRETERATLWAALHAVRRERAPRRIVLHGGAGTGRTRLLDWIAEHAAATGAARVSRGPTEPDGAPTLVCLDDGAVTGPLEGPTLVARVGDPLPGEVVLVVPPLTVGELRQLAMEGLGLEPGLAHRLADAARGRPQWLVQLVADWHAGGLLVAGERAFTLRGGLEPEVPDRLEAVWAARVRTLGAGPAVGGRAAVGLRRATGATGPARAPRRPPRSGLRPAPRPGGPRAARRRRRTRAVPPAS